MNPVVAKIMTFGAVTGVAAVVALSMGKTALGAETSRHHAALSMAGRTAFQVTDFSVRKKGRYYSAFPFAVTPPRYYHGGANPNYGLGTAQMREARRQNRCVAAPPPHAAGNNAMTIP